MENQEGSVVSELVWSLFDGVGSDCAWSIDVPMEGMMTAYLIGKDRKILNKCEDVCAQFGEYLVACRGLMVRPPEWDFLRWLQDAADDETVPDVKYTGWLIQDMLHGVPVKAESYRTIPETSPKVFAASVLWVMEQTFVMEVLKCFGVAKAPVVLSGTLFDLYPKFVNVLDEEELTVISRFGVREVKVEASTVDSI